MSSDPKTVSELRERLLDKATTDDGFRAKLIDDPKAAIKNELGLAIPDGFTVKVHEEKPDTSHLVLPPPASLSVSEMEEAAAGAVSWNSENRTWDEMDDATTFWDDW